ncbi:MAG: hypothetical protein J5651_00520 [Salinivirgaceae bacterium]|nr:hypothetical protein [Salinivirgaceae bacterium]
MITADFFSDTPAISGKDAERFLKAMEAPKPLPKEQLAEMRRAYQNFLSRRVVKK